MYKLFLALLCIASVERSFAQAYDYRNPSIDVQHYVFNLELSDASDTVRGIAQVRIKALKSISAIPLDLMSVDTKGKGMRVLSVTQDGKKVTYSHKNSILQINTETPLNAGEEKTVEIQYSGVPADGLIIDRNKYKDRTVFSDNWPNRARHWLPCNDHPSDKSSVEFAVTAPQHYQVVSNGLQVEETNLSDNKRLTRYIENVPLPTKVMVIGLADFAIQHLGSVECVPVSSWVYRQDRTKASADYGQAVTILPFFIRNVGPFAYPKLANVQSKTIFGGMENAGAIFYFENSVNGKGEHEGLIAHEIAHQWFGNMATEKHWSHIWLSEGFASYMTHLYMESKYGEEKLKDGLQKDRQQIISFFKQNRRPVVDTSENNYMNLLNANSYQKGSWVLHMLRRQVGDSSFWNSVRKYYATYAGGNAETKDLQKVFEDVSGQKLDQFFQQWLFTPGHPQLEISWNYDAKKKTLNVRTRQTQEKLFEFPLQMNIRTGGEEGVLTKSSRINGRESSFSIPLTAKPQALIVDPNMNLLHEVVLKEQVF